MTVATANAQPESPYRSPAFMAEMGKRAGRTRSIDAVAQRVEALVAQAPSLSPTQLDRLGLLLRNATDAVDNAKAPQAVRSA